MVVKQEFWVTATNIRKRSEGSLILSLDLLMIDPKVRMSILYLILLLNVDA
jgi:hypothetical protein